MNSNIAQKYHYEDGDFDEKKLTPQDMNEVKETKVTAFHYNSILLLDAY
jgi:hypothetical protein